ncbi:MAG: redoxin family protein [Chromatiaceae bacterium]|jgi:hypothetical protein
MRIRGLGTITLTVLIGLPLSTAALDQDDFVAPPERTPNLSLGPTPLAPANVGIGQPIPDLQVQGADGQLHGLSRLVGERGGVIVVRDPDCPVSRRYGPRIAELAAFYADQGFGFVMIYPNVSVDATLRAQDQRPLRVPGVYVAQGSFALANALGVNNTGDTFVIDRDLRLRYRGAVDDQFGIGYTRPLPTRHYLRNALDDLAAGRPIATPATTAPGCQIDADPALDRWFDRLPAGHLVG